MRCLVTGAAGFVGSTLSERLLRDGHEVIGVDCFVDYYPRSIKESNLEALISNPRFQFHEGDLLKINLDPLLHNVEWIFHQAAQAGVRASWGELFESYTNHNILSTQRLLHAARQIASLKKIVFASSSSVYGNAESFPTREDALPQPVSPYGVTKLAAEHLMGLYAVEHGVPTVSLRYFTVFGPRQRPDMAFHKFIKSALKGEEITLYGDGEQTRDFTYIDDIVNANILAAERGKGGSVFNIGGGTVVSVNQVLEIMSSHLGKIRVKRSERQQGDARHTSADTTAAQRDLGYKPLVSLEVGIAHEIAWMKKFLGQ